jgi:(1->4)-alpha-D-glucan 1-alpha-D-glucosylmutase
MGGTFRRAWQKSLGESRSACNAGIADGVVKPVQVPISTYRLQFNGDFRFTDALEIIDYLQTLGVTDLYASPLLKARTGSTHGYDVTDPTELNPEIGTAEEFDRLSQALKERGMGLLLDIVPNHMAASLENPWWFDVLEKGEKSRYAEFFDVDWTSKKILLPILGKPYGEVLENKELQVRMVNGRPVLKYYEQKLPLAAGAENLSGDAVDRVVSRQHYRLAHWRKAADAINYRRFFDINDLAGLRTERDDVFHATHDYILKLVDEGKVTGLRIDHIDGLRDPKAYLDRLPGVFVAVEKILAANEQIPDDWKVEGTTGYDFTNYVNGAFIDPEGFRKLEKIYTDVTGKAEPLTQIFRERKRQVMRELFTGEVQALVDGLAKLAEADRHARDLRSEDLREAFVSVTACLPAYRTYIRSTDVAETDRALINDAIREAGKGASFDFLRRVLLVEPAWYLQRQKPEYLDFAMRWQQFTGPVMAKGLEDTSFYVHNPLISVNEVGGDSSGPESYFGVEEFHRRNLKRHKHWPHTMNASSTHDTKRSEDVRARINVLSELTEVWARALRRWMRIRPSKEAPDPNEQILIYQSMLGAWPIELDRLKQFLTKALREGKTHTSWVDIDEDYERRVHAFLESLYKSRTFLADFQRLQKKVAYYGAVSSLAQVVLKATSPGVPDFYRGSELWDFSLADPDNRRPIDFSSRMHLLQKAQHSTPRELLKTWEDGSVKMFVTWKLLQLRRESPDLFLKGDYIPLRVSGTHADHVIAFARRFRSKWCLVAVPRLCASLTRAGSPPLGARIWKRTHIHLPPGVPSSWTNILTGESLESPATCSALFHELPIAVLTHG